MAFGILTLTSLAAVNLAIDLVASWLLPMRRRGLFLILMVVAGLPVFSRNAFTIDIGPLNVLGYLINYGLLPYLFWDAPRTHRIICAALVMLIELITEAYFSLLLISMGLSLDRSLSSPAHVWARFGSVLIVLAAGKLFALIVSRTIRRPPHAGTFARAEGDKPQAPAGAERGSGGQDRAYLLFVGPQLCFALISLFALSASQGTAPEAYLMLLGLVLLCLAIDVLVLASIRRHASALAARERARALEDQLVVHIAAEHSIHVQANRMACFRHDQRNHLQTTRVLIECGDAERARSYVAELRGEHA